MSFMGNMRTCHFKGVNGNFEWIDKSSQFYKSDDVGVQTTAYVTGSTKRGLIAFPIVCV